MSLCLVLGEEETRRFYYVFSFYFVPLEVGGVTFSRYADFLTVDNEEVLFSAEIDGAIELTVHRVVLEHVSQVVNGAEVIDTYNLNVIAAHGSAENETANTTETVNTYFDHNRCLLLKLL